VAALRREIDARRLDCRIQIDGGVNAANVSAVAAAGADSIVAGSAVFGAPDVAAAFRDLSEKARAAYKS
jgi:ribulose-phosphate 3-epimerase